MMYRYFGYPGNMGGWFGFGLSWIFQILFWLIIIWVVFALFRRASHRTDDSEDSVGRPTPLDLLKERYAKGEITKKQFDEIKKDIS